MKRILTSVHGQSVGLADDQRLVVPKGFLAGAFGTQFAMSSPDRFVHHDDFVGAAISSAWNVAKGSDGSAANFAINVQQNGVARGSTGAGAGATMAVNGVQLAGALNWYANAGGLTMAARLKLSSIATVAVFVGFTNQTAALQMPATGSGTGNGLTFNANDCVGVLFDTTMTTADWWLVGNAATVNATAQDCGSGPTAATYDTWQIDVDTAGNATFFRGAGILTGVQQGVRMVGAVTPTVALTPVVAAFARAAASVNVDLDYLHASAVRV